MPIDQKCLLWGSRVVIPSKLQPVVLNLLHEQHPGVSRMKMLARSRWPGLDQAIEDTVATCNICQVTRNVEPRIPFKQWSMTTFRWQRVHIDYVEDLNTREQLLILVDSFSKWIEVFVMKTTTSTKTIERIRTLFSSFGLPKEIVTDNATCFSSYELQDFSKENGGKLTSPPYHCESNGVVERCVHTFK